MNQHILFKTIDKYIRFRGLVKIANRTKEECYRDLDVVTRHYKKAGFLLNKSNVTASLNKLWVKWVRI